MAKKTRETLPAGAASEWDRLEARLARDEVRGEPAPSGAPDPDGFDKDELKVLRRLATRARLAHSRGARLGNVVFLHGITGSDLETVENGDRDHIWVNFPRLVLGQIRRLRLSADGTSEADSRYRVVATRVNKRYYARAILSLRARWHVEPFAYDWRRSIDAAADDLAAFIRSRFPGQTVHLVAHSMGGLVARNLVRRHPQLWEAMQDHDPTAGGRLVMLGTPNYGSFAIVQAMTGEDQLIAVLERCDLVHDMSQLLEITNTFPGSYELLPAPSKLSGTLGALYQADTWPENSRVSQRHLNRAYEFHGALESGATIDARRMIYVAGCRRPTVVGMTIAGDGDFEYSLSYDGDGRVPHALGLLPGVPTYYVDEAHGDLARNETVLAALDDLLASGSTTRLSTTVLRRAERAVPSAREYRSATERELMTQLERIARQTQEPGGPAAVSPQDRHLAEDALIQAALGTGRSRPPAAADRASGRVPDAGRRVRLRVRVTLADVCDVAAPAVVVGHYRGVAPANALGALDRRLGNWISLAVKRGMIGGNLGELLLVPTRGRRTPAGKRVAAAMVVVAGMGDDGTFTEDRLRVLMTNVAMGVGALGVKSLATVLVGAGEGNLDPGRVLRALVDGVASGLVCLREETGKATALQEVVIVEHHPQRFLDLLEQVAALTNDDSLGALVQTRRPNPAEVRRARSLRSRPPRLPKAAPSPAAVETTRPREVRLTLESPDDGKGKFRFSALSPSAVVPVRDVDVNPTVFAGLGMALQNAAAGAEQEQYGRLLFDYLVPEDFDQVIGDARSLRLVLDRATASFPWEMACFRPRSGGAAPRWLGLDLELTRQFKTMLSRPPGTTPPLNAQVRALVIADPAPEPELQLPFARREGRSVVEALRRARRADLRIEIESRIGSGECDIVEILALILTGDFDVVHFAGHGDYDPASPAGAGWVFSREHVITARDIFRARRVPRLVFANACFSGVIHAGPAHGIRELSRGLATIARWANRPALP
jgi:pimeloyl-ACP methyl ester carboxylesterase